METTISTLVSNPTGNGGNAPLSAMIDKTIAEHIMTRQRFDELKNEFNWPSATPGPDEILYDSRGVTYTAQNKVSLLIRPRHGRCSERFMFYLVKSDSALFTGGHDLVLARSWLGKFPRNGLDSSRVHSAAPSELLKGKSRQGGRLLFCT
ncbi:hypothetical protein BJY04DRAFT_194988 [Aspergillus karnatakaensis]|uniref:uncharacterized protein n=1 Tax=Aspergillus karnatakaensis TaxID=1810916 RepID=UPI003CCD9608